MTEARFLRPITDTDLDMLLTWRNAAETRKCMYSSTIIRPKEHTNWYESIRDDHHRHPLLFIQQGVPSGFVNIGPIKPGRIAKWGFYTAPSAQKGTGRALGRCALEYAFEELNLHKLCGEAIAFNEPSRRLHLALGFTEEGELREQFFDGKQYHDIIVFGLIARQWRVAATRENYE